MNTIDKKAAVFISNYSIGKSSPVICLLDCLLRRYCEVDLHIYRAAHLDCPIISRINNVFDYSHFANVFDVNHLVDKEYDYYIALDANGFVLCKTLYPHAETTYYSLELYFTYNHYNLPYHPMVQYTERKYINTIKGLIIQSKERERIFRAEYLLDDSIPTFLLPVGYLHPSSKEKTDFLRKKFNIPQDKKIVLHIGGIHEYFCLLEIIHAFKYITDCFLVLHGNYSPNYLSEIIFSIKKNNIQNVVISHEFINDIDELDKIISSADIGIAWYKDLGPNFTAIDKSSGKIASYLRFGIPVITNAYESLVDSIQRTGCGICISDFSELPNALERIMLNYNLYSANCTTHYDKDYWFENYRNSLIDFIETDFKNNNHVTSNIYINPSPKDNIDIYHYNIASLNAIKQFIANCRGIFLNIISGNNPYKPFVFYNYSITKYLEVSITRQYQQIPLEDNAVDCVMVIDVFEHLDKIDAMLQEIKRVLRPLGILFFIVPFLLPLHDSPYDSYRYTPFSIRRHLENVGFINFKIEALGGWDASLAQMIGLWLMCSPMGEEERTKMFQLFYPFYEMLINTETELPKKEYSDMLKECIMITGISCTATLSK